MRLPVLRLGLAATVTAASISLLPLAAAAHADADVVAVAAGEQATINFRPNHGCGESPTTEVAVRVPVRGATGGDVDGWTWTAEDDGDGRTIVEWTGGSLPTDVTGAFPVTFEVPDQVGELVLFPAVQVCENGEELSWLNGDPESDNPVPRLLILEAGSEEARSIDELPEGIPGRELLTAVVDTEPTTTTTSPSTTSTFAGDTTTPSEGASTTTPTAPAAGPADEGGGSGVLAFLLVGGVAVVLLAGGIYLRRRER
ncbi:MAG: DUF1775 domain-containing protein [Acidimicrobiales bacterium]